MRKIIIGLIMCVSLTAQELGGPKKITPSDIISQAHIALGRLLHDQADIRTDEDFENFKIRSAQHLLEMKELAGKIPEAEKLTNFERREVMGIAMRYRYELFPPSIGGDFYLKDVPEKYHGELRKMAEKQPPEISNLWKYIAEVTMPVEEDGFSIPIGSEKIDPSISVVVSLGRAEERPNIDIDPATSRPTPFSPS